MKRFLVLCATTCLTGAALAQVNDSSVVSSTYGTSTSVSGGSAFNVAGSSTPSAAFGLLDFKFVATTGTVNGLTLTLEQPDPPVQSSGVVDFYVTTYAGAEGGLRFAGTSANDNLDANLYSSGATLYKLGSETYTSTVVDQKDTYTFTGLNSSLATYLTGQLNTGGTVRIVAAVEEPHSTLAALRYYGSGASTPGYVPGLGLSLQPIQSVPEPVSLIALSAGLVGFVARRRK